jgi:8-oxo-dGTP pyrophosphatase MutT (NUDIX family)
MQMLQPHHFKRFLIDSLSRTSPRALAVPNLQRAGVLVPLVNAGEHYNFLFTKRTEIVDTHKGQVSFPGGVTDPVDSDIRDTALREVWEELGIARSAIEAIGLLDDLQTPTGFIITPVIGVIENMPALSINIHEVAEVFQVPVGFFVDPANGRSELRILDGKQREVWSYDTGTHVIWGATAMIIRSLLSTLGMIE